MKCREIHCWDCPINQQHWRAMYADTLIVNPRIRIEDMFAEHGSITTGESPGMADILFSTDYHPGSMINAGKMSSVSMNTYSEALSEPVFGKVRGFCNAVIIPGFLKGWLLRCCND